MRLPVTRLVLLAVAALAVAAPGTAGAAVTVGSSLAPSDRAEACAQACTIVQRKLGERTYRSPADGVIVRWRVRDAEGPIRLRLVRGIRGVGTSATVRATAPGIGTFPTRLPVRAGDELGIDLLGGTVGVRDTTPEPAEQDVWEPVLVDGETREPTRQILNSELLLNADVEADADGDGFGDETQDLCPGDRGRQAACQADLELRIFEPLAIVFGRSASTTIRVRNAGSSTAEGTTVRAGIPPPVVLGEPRCSRSSVGALGAPACAISGPGQVTFTIGSLPAGESAEVVLPFLTFSLDPVRVQATARSTTADPDADDNDDERVTRVSLQNGRCRNARAGTPANDRLFGTAGGDALDGQAGDDTLSGLAGRDCLKGGSGADRLSGGASDDRVEGGPGDDIISVGSGRNIVIAGPGSDRVNVRNKRRDRVSCGSGNDRVLADRVDRLTGCERKR